MVTERPPLPTFSLAVAPSLSAFNVSMKQYLTTHGQHESAIATGALVFDSQDRMLLVQRAAHDSMPNCWETPGGGVDTDDPTILHGLARELFEEASLKAISVRQQVGDGYVFFSRRGLRIVKFNFVVDVENTEDVGLDPNEHQNFVWASEEECRSGKVAGGEGKEVLEIKFTTVGQKRTVLEGFRVSGESRGDGVS